MLFGCLSYAASAIRNAKSAVTGVNRYYTLRCYVINSLLISLEKNEHVSL